MSPARPPRRPRPGGRSAPPRRSPRKPAPAPAPPVGPLRLGAVPGATPGKWISIWRERMPGAPLSLVPLAADAVAAALHDDTVDIAIARLPLGADDLHVIPLYEEDAVVVASEDSVLAAADALTIADLAGQTRIVPSDDVIGAEIPGTTAPAFRAGALSTEDAIATVAAGSGFVVVPHSLARLHRRRDAAVRPLAGASALGVSLPVGLAWRVENDSPAIEAFIGIVRGRRPGSSR